MTTDALMIPVSLTNRLRHAMDYWLPRRVRDSRWFMYPFFFIWFRGRNVELAMDFKSLTPGMTTGEFREACRTVVSLGEDRESDTNPRALAHVLSLLPTAGSLLDVGCGRGHFLRAVQRQPGLERLQLTGCDLVERSETGAARYTVADVEALPFGDASFDVVTCFHTLEHVRDLRRAIAELRRVTASRLVIVVPRQRAFHHTLDLHLQFFETPDDLRRALGEHVPVDQFGSDLIAVVKTHEGMLY